MPHTAHISRNPHRRIPGFFLTALGVLLLLGAAGTMRGFEPKGRASLDRLVFAHPDLYVPGDYRRLEQLPAGVAEKLRSDLAALGIKTVGNEVGFYDPRTGRWDTLIQSTPLIPGPGVGNDLQWSERKMAAPGSDTERKEAVWRAFAAYLAAYRGQLGVDPAELSTSPRIAVHEKGRVIQIYAPRVVGGVGVRESFVNGVVNSGNLILFGSRNWAPVNVLTEPSIPQASALALVREYLKGLEVKGFWRRAHLELIPAMSSVSADGTTRSLTYRLAWVISPQIEGDLGAWEGLVDAHSGELLTFADQNQYLQRKVKGGIYPVSNDGLSVDGVPDGVEQPGFPMPFADVRKADGTTTHTNSAGIAQADGPITTTLSGLFVRINDNCGFIEETTPCQDLDLGSGPGTDCVTPAGSHSPGDTHSARTGFYEVNRIIEQAKGWVPNTYPVDTPPAGWLHRQLTANMNINNTCNAFWTPVGGTINFYREGPSATGSVICRNTGEIAAVFDHEWGHGLDNNDNIPAITVPGEAYADITAILRLNTSCVGRGFLKSLGDGTMENLVFCGGNGDPCTECTGVREIDWMKRASEKPHDIDWVLSVNPNVPGGCATPDTIPLPTGVGTGPCGFGTHCEGTIVGEAFWDLLKRDLPCNGPGWDIATGQCNGGAAPTIDENTALEIVARLFYVSSGNVNRWYQCNPLAPAGGNPNGGCLSDSGYMNLLAVDDDNGLLADGTPHMRAIHAAFNRHQIACNLPLPTDSSTANFPTQAPTVSAAALPNGALVSWNNVPKAVKYWVFRTEGVHGCDFGKERIAEVTATNYTDTGLLDGFEYFYSVVPVGGGAGNIANDAYFGPMSACASVVPLASPGAGAANLTVQEVPNGLTISGGDNDEYIDNCEIGTLQFNVFNSGGVALTNVRVVDIRPVSHPEINIQTALPIPLGSLAAVCNAPGGSATTSFQFSADGLSHGDTIRFEVDVTADQLGSPQTGILTIHDAETDRELGDVTFTFETSTEGWQVAQGTYQRSSAGGGANGSAWYMASSAGLSDICDQVRSPSLRLTASSTLSLHNQFTIEPDQAGTFYDRANVGLVDTGTGVRTTVSPDGGRVYNVPDGAEFGSCVTTQEAGWAGAGLNWVESTWSSSALGVAGLGTGSKDVAIDIAYGTDTFVSLTGFWFDEVTVTNALVPVPDAQSDVCPPPAQPDLRVTNITASNNKAREGEKVTITARVTNSGTGNAGSSVTEFRLDGTTILGQVATGPIAAGAHRDVSIFWDTRSVKGHHTIYVTADQALQVAESNEGNNTSSRQVEVKGNKVKNGSFEEGSTSGPGPAAWTGSSTGAGNATWSDGGSDGAKSASFTGNGGNAALFGSPSWTSDPIAVTAGSALSLVVSVQSTGASSAPTAGLMCLGAAGELLNTVTLITAPLTTSGFSRLEQAVTIPAGVASVRVKLLGFSPADTATAGTVTFDDVGLFDN